MRSLEQRLKGLGKDQFESLVHEFLLSRFPGAGIKKVDGTGGDRGIDSFSGDLQDGPAIWQSKHFPDRIRKPQRKQILESVKTAFESWKPKRWTLCIPIDLRTDEHQWFQRDVTRPYGERAKIELIQASDFLSELAHNRPLRDAFFPDNSISNALAIRQMAIGTENASVEQKEQLALESAQQYLEGTADLEPRLQPSVTFGLAKMPTIDRRVPGAVLSVKKGEVLVDFFPRDPATYNLDPIGFHVTLNRSHSNDLETAINTGTPFRSPVGAILKLDSASPLLRHLFQQSDLAHIQMELHPIVPGDLASKEFPLRLVAASASNIRELSHVPFKLTQLGRQEITLTSCSRLPIEVSIKARPFSEKAANVRIRPLVIGADVVELEGILDFLDALQHSGEIEVFSLEPPGRLFWQAGYFSNRLKIPGSIRKLVSDLKQISKFFKAPLRMPEKITNEDLENILTLRRIATGEQLSDFELSASLIKDPKHDDPVLSFLGGVPLSIRMENPEGWAQVQLFGAVFDCSRAALIADNVVALDAEKTRGEYLAAPKGAQIPLKA